MPPIAGTLRQQFRRVPQQRLATRHGQIAAGDADIREQVVIEFSQSCEFLPSFDEENESPEALDEHQQGAARSSRRHNGVLVVVGRGVGVRAGSLAEESVLQKLVLQHESFSLSRTGAMRRCVKSPKTRA
jgi:hypothetical protein